MFAWFDEAFMADDVNPTQVTRIVIGNAVRRNDGERKFLDWWTFDVDAIRTRLEESADQGYIPCDLPDCPSRACITLRDLRTVVEALTQQRALGGA